MMLKSNKTAELHYLCPGLYQKKGKLVFLGLDNAGKTSLLNRLKFGTMATPHPTGQPHCEELQIADMTFRTHDLGGHKQARRVWREYLPAVDAVVFLLDVSDPGRFREAHKELQGLLKDELTSGVPLLILGNKIDDPRAAGEFQLRTAFGLHGLTTGKETASLPEGRRAVELFMCSVKEKQGYGEAFRWLAQHF
ncbi:small COPII coat GTPase SAR1B-like [Branchiostoma lanceolatum]|uniref:small COPII coat GTPase SAR1B-like n=1 Tax=Branchiostoma lanceolatum TaxID=7740 RepID=UPI0034553E42